MTMGRHVMYDGKVSISTWRRVEKFPGIGFLLEQAAQRGGATPLATHVITLPDPERSRSDSPPGGTAWVGLDESHVTLHWYDGGHQVRFALDVFTCGDRADPSVIISHVLAFLVGCTGRRTEVKRFAGMG